MLSGKKPAILFIIGGGLNYISAVLAEHYPKITCVSLQPSDDFFGNEINTPLLNWYPSSTHSLHEIIEKAIAANRLAGGVMVLEWPPVVNQFKEVTGWIRTTLRDMLEKASSNAATLGYWATRWLGNCLRFVTSVTNTAKLIPGTSLVVVACAGPSLADQMPEIQARRSELALWSLASAVPALLRHGLIPDLVIATDPGYWNGAHLREAFLQKLPIAMPPSSYASCGILQKSTIIPIDTGLSFERVAIQASNFESEVASASGSAAGTALSLALRLTTGPIALAGYDLASSGLLDHVQPYAFDILDHMNEGRLAPAYSARVSRVFEHYPIRSGAWRCSRAFSTYADTIQVSAQNSARVFRLGTSSVETPLHRSDFSAIPHSTGDPPTCIASTTHEGAATLARDNATKAMLESLSTAAQEQAITAVENSEPLPYDAALYYKALAPRESAGLIADAARGEAKLEDVIRATSAARESATIRLR